MSGSMYLKRVKLDEKIIEEWEAEFISQVQSIPSQEILMESYPPAIGQIGIAFEQFGGARAIFAIQNLLTLTNKFCKMIRLNLNGRLVKLIRWILISGDSGSGKTPAMNIIRDIIQGLILI